MIKECPICGRLFVAKRSDAICCSAACRVKKNRKGKKDGIRFDEAAKVATVNDATGVLDRAHVVAVDMSRIAMFAPMPLAESLTRIAGKIESALRSEGL